MKRRKKKINPRQHKSPKFSKRHYEAIAETFAERLAELAFSGESKQSLKDAINSMCDMFRKDNSRFDGLRFREYITKKAEELTTGQKFVEQSRNPGVRLSTDEIELWVKNDDGLYRWWKSSRLPMQKFIRENREELKNMISSRLIMEPHGRFNPRPRRRNSRSLNIIQERKGRYGTDSFEPAVGECSCGGDVELSDELENICHRCGQGYNYGGDPIRPRSQWEEPIEPEDYY